MYWVGYTLNNITMLGLILAIGIVIDDAVVINENIFRHMEEDGVSAMKAASSATKEIALAVSATTLSLLVIFIPVVFMGGRIGRFFSSFGAVVAFSILMSWFVSFTMTPMLCSRFLKRKPNRGHSKEGLVWRSIDSAYGWVLGWSLRHRWVIVTTTVALLVATVFLFKIVGFDFIPRDDQSEFEVAMTLPEGYTLTQADKLFAEIEGRIGQLKGVTNVFTTIGDTTGRDLARPRGRDERDDLCPLDRSRRTHAPLVRLAVLVQRDLQSAGSGSRSTSRSSTCSGQAREIMADYTDLRTAVQDAAFISGAGFRQAMVDLNLRGPDLQKLQEYSVRIMEWMKQQPRVRGYRHEPVTAQAGTARADRPGTRFGPGDFGPDDRLDAQRAGRRRTGDEVQGAGRTVRRLAACRDCRSVTGRTRSGG